MTQLVPVLPTPTALPDWPVFWFAKLELAVRAGDFVAALEATRELERRGVTVVFAHPCISPVATPTEPTATRKQKAVRT